MYSTEFMATYAADRMAAAHHHAWVGSLRPSPRERLARGLHRLAARLQPDLESTTSVSGTAPRRAY